MSAPRSPINLRIATSKTSGDKERLAFPHLFPSFSFSYVSVSTLCVSIVFIGGLLTPLVSRNVGIPELIALLKILWSSLVGSAFTWFCFSLPVSVLMLIFLLLPWSTTSPLGDRARGGMVARLWDTIIILRAGWIGEYCAGSRSKRFFRRENWFVPESDGN